MNSSQRVFSITDLIREIGKFKKEFEYIDNINYITELLIKLNKLSVKYINNSWTPHTLRNNLTGQQDNKLKNEIKKLLFKIEYVFENHIFTNKEKYDILIINLYNIIFMDMNKLTHDLKNTIDINPYHEMGPLYFLSYKTVPELNNLLSDFRIRYSCSILY